MVKVIMKIIVLLGGIWITRIYATYGGFAMPTQTGLTKCTSCVHQPEVCIHLSESAYNT